MHEVEKFGPRFGTDTLTFLLSLWKLRNRSILREWKYFLARRTRKVHLISRATRCGVNPKSNRSAVKFRARARYMQWVPESEPRKSRCRRRDAMPSWDEREGRKKKNNKNPDRKTNGGQGRRCVRARRGDSERSMPWGGKDINALLEGERETRQKSSS